MDLAYAPEVLAKMTYNYIETHPERWNQRDWCFCFAGWAVRLGAPAQDMTLPTANLARELLALDFHRAHWLFDSENSLDDIRALLEGWGML